MAGFNCRLLVPLSAILIWLSLALTVATVVTKDCSESRRQHDARDREASGGGYRSGRHERGFPGQGHSHALQRDQEEERCVAGKLGDGHGTQQRDGDALTATPSYGYP